MIVNRIKAFGTAVIATTMLLCGTVSASRVVDDGKMHLSDALSYAAEMQINKKYFVECQHGSNDCCIFKYTPSETVKGTFRIADFDFFLEDGIVFFFEDNFDSNCKKYRIQNSSPIEFEAIMTKGHTYYILATSENANEACNFSLTLKSTIKIGWNQKDGAWYYFDKNYYVVTDRRFIGDSYYYFAGNGQMVTGWYLHYDTWFFCEPDGKLCLGWKKIGDNWYYFDDEHSYNYGAMYVGKCLIGDHYYYFDEDGHMLRNRWIESFGKYMYADENGYVINNGWKKIGGEWYYFINSEMQTYLIEVNSDVYYLDDNGHMLTGWIKESEEYWHHAESDGRLDRGWKKINGYWYYFSDDQFCDMTTGWININGKEYYLRSSGEMVTGWHKIDGNWFYFESDGSMIKGWKKLSGVWYYFGENGEMYTGTHVLGGNTYVFDSNGHWVSNA